MNDTQRLAKLQQAEKLLKQTREGYPGPNKGTFWRPALKLIDELEQDLKPKPVRFRFPIAAPPDIHVLVGGLHATAGLAHNWALDFICHAGLGICAPVAGKLSAASPGPVRWASATNSVPPFSTYWASRCPSAAVNSMSPATITTG